MKIGPITITYTGLRFRTSWKQEALQGHKIAAIKAFKTRHPCSLKEAKDKVEAYMRKHDVPYLAPWS